MACCGIQPQCPDLVHTILAEPRGCCRLPSLRYGHSRHFSIFDYNVRHLLLFFFSIRPSNNQYVFSIRLPYMGNLCLLSIRCCTISILVSSSMTMTPQKFIVSDIFNGNKSTSYQRSKDTTTASDTFISDFWLHPRRPILQRYKDRSIS
jgi:hypothetical protein